MSNEADQASFVGGVFNDKTCFGEELGNLCRVKTEFAVGTAGEVPSVAGAHLEEIVHFDVVGLAVEEAGKDAVGFAADWNEALRAS